MSAGRGPARGVQGQRGLVLLSVIVLLLLLAMLAAGLGARLSWQQRWVGHVGHSALQQTQARLWLAQLYALDVSFLEPNQNALDCVAVARQLCGYFSAEHSDSQTWRFILIRETEPSDSGETDGSVAELSGWLRRDANDASRVDLVWLTPANPT